MKWAIAASHLILRSLSGKPALSSAQFLNSTNNITNPSNANQTMAKHKLIPSQDPSREGSSAASAHDSRYTSTEVTSYAP